MNKFYAEEITGVHHWTESLFSFTTTRSDGLRFKNGQFVMIGLEVEGKPLMRAYSIASPNYEEELEFFSIKVPDGPLTSRLQHLQRGDQIMISKKPTGTLVLDDLLPGRNLYLFSTGTGLAPFLSVIQDPETYERFEKVVLLHGVRWKKDLAYQEFLTQELFEHEYLSEEIRNKFIYYPCVTREQYIHQGRITDLVASGQLAQDLGLPQLNPETDRAMICGSPNMLKDLSQMLDARGFNISQRMGEPGDYVIERAFVD